MRPKPQGQAKAANVARPKPQGKAKAARDQSRKGRLRPPGAKAARERPRQSGQGRKGRLRP